MLRSVEPSGGVRTQAIPHDSYCSYTRFRYEVCSFLAGDVVLPDNFQLMPRERFSGQLIVFEANR